MNKSKAAVLGAAIITAMSLAACNLQPEPISEEVLTESEPVQSEEIITSESEGEVQTGTAYETALEGKYADFINGNEVLYFNKENAGYLDYIFDEWIEDEYQLDYSKGYTLDEFKNLLEDAIWADGCQIGSANYYALDLGGDGNLEMCLEFGDMSTPDYESASFVIKETQGQLRCVYCFLGMARWEYNITYDGVVQGGGSGGAGYHVYDEGYLDAEGNYHRLYDWEETYPGWSSYASDVFKTIDTGLLEMEEKGFYGVTAVVSFDGQTPSNDFCTGFGVLDSNNNEVGESDAVYSEIKQIYLDAGVNVLEIEELDQMVDDRCLAQGITKEMREIDDRIVRVSLF